MRQLRHCLVAVILLESGAVAVAGPVTDTLTDTSPVSTVIENQVDVLEQRGAVMVRVPFDGQGRAIAEKAQMRVLEGPASANLAVSDYASAEVAWNEARVPGYIHVDRGLDESPAEPVPIGYYSWRRGYAPAFVSAGYGWRYGLPGFYFGWNTASNSFSFGYGPGFSYGHVPGFGYAGGYSGWYGTPLGPSYTYPYPYWYRPGFGYYYYPRVGGGIHRL